MPPIQTLIVDDEPLARRRVAQLLAEAPDFVVAGECGNGGEAVAALSGGPAVDVVFLDVQMPDCSGLQVLQQLQYLPRLPLVVFVTAHDHYALPAFEAHAVDYLLKPLDPDRFGGCLAHLRQCAAGRLAGPLQEHLAALVRGLPVAPPPPAYPAQLLVRQPGRLYFVPTAQVQYLEATANYVTVHAQEGPPHVLRTTLAQLERQLDPDRFLRIHRSLIVGVDHVKELHPWTHGEYLLVLLDGTRLSSSRGYREGLQRFLDRFIS